MLQKLRNIIAFSLLPLFITGQEVVYITYLQDSAAVGESIDLMITTEADPNSISSFEIKALEDIKFFSPTSMQKDSVVSEKADVNIINLGLWKDEDKDGIVTGEEMKWESSEEDGKMIHRNKIKLAFFDVGIYAFDGFTFQHQGRENNSNRALMKITFKDYQLQVVDSTGLAPIKNIEKEPLKIQDFLPYLLYILLPILLIYLGYRYIQKRNARLEMQEVPEEVVVIPPDVQALTSLKTLRSRELWQKGEIKQYQSELSHIVREYLEGRYDIQALESTTSQIIRSIKDASFTSSDQENLKRILQISDLVKFAKAKPEVNVHEEFMNDAIDFVQRTRQEANLLNSEEE